MSSIKIHDNLVLLNNLHDEEDRFGYLTKAQIKNVKIFNDLIRKGESEFEEVPCLCGNTTFDLIASVDRYGFLQKTVICKKCGLILSNPRMTKDSYESFYTSDFYRLSYESSDHIAVAEKKYLTNVGEHIYNSIRKIKKINKNTNILEFGAGGGWNLAPFKKLGCNVLGIDYSPSLVTFGQTKGIPMKQGGLSIIEGEYDLIILNHVYEHFLHPIEDLKILIEHLKSDGIIYIAVPNILNFRISQIQNAHTYYFTPITFKYYLNRIGLQLVDFGESEKIHMYGIFMVGDTVNNDINLKENYNTMIKIIKNVRFKEYFLLFMRKIHLYNTLIKIIK